MDDIERARQLLRDLEALEAEGKQERRSLAEFQDRGEAARRAAGIDGTAGDAQDIEHRFVADEEVFPFGVCLVCGLNESYGKHT